MTSKRIWQSPVVSSIAPVVSFTPTRKTFVRSLPDSLVVPMHAVWNMLSLSPQLHDWWSRGLFDFYCSGVTNDGE